MITVAAEHILEPGTEDNVDALMPALGGEIFHKEPRCTRIDYVVDASNMSLRLEELHAPGGVGAEGVFRMGEGGTPFSTITELDRYGNRIEYVGTDAADPLVEWARTGVFPTGIGA